MGDSVLGVTWGRWRDGGRGAWTGEVWFSGGFVSGNCRVDIVECEAGCETSCDEGEITIDLGCGGALGALGVCSVTIIFVVGVDSLTPITGSSAGNDSSILIELDAAPDSGATLVIGSGCPEGAERDGTVTTIFPSLTTSLPACKE